MLADHILRHATVASALPAAPSVTSAPVLLGNATLNSNGTYTLNFLELTSAMGMTVAAAVET